MAGGNRILIDWQPSAPTNSLAVRGAQAGAAYGSITVAAGFVLGALRMLFIAPLLGAATALVLEVLTILIVSWSVARWCATAFQVPQEMGARLMMAGVGLAVKSPSRVHPALMDAEDEPTGRAALTAREQDTG